MRGIKSEKHELQRSAVLEEAAKVFSEKGYATANLNDIASRLNISRTVLYYYFSSKKSILTSLADQIVEAKERHLEMDNCDLPPLAQLRQMAYSEVLFVIRNRFVYLALIKAEEELEGEARQRHFEAKKSLLIKFEAVIKKGIEVGDFRPVDSAVAALGIIGMCSWCAFWFSDGGRLKDTDVASHLSSMALASVVGSEMAAGTEHIISSSMQNLEDALKALKYLTGR